MFDVKFEPRRNLIATRCIGFWQDAEVDAYCADFVTEANRARRPFGALIDMSDFPPQSASGSAKMGEMVKQLKMMGLERVAILAHSAILRMQANRIGAGNHRFFESEQEARLWLASGMHGSHP